MFVKQQNYISMRKFLILQAAFILSCLLTAQEGENPESRFLKNTRQLIHEGNRSGEGYFSEDGRYLIFQSEREPDNPFYQIYILDFETGDINRVSPGHGKTTCAYFQWGGDRVLYSSSHHDPDILQKQQDELDFRASGQKRRYAWDYEPEMDIFSSLPDGSDIQQLTFDYGYDAEGSYSPDGKLIVYSSNKNAFNRDLTKEEQQKLEVDPAYFCDLFIMNADGSGKRQLTDVPGYDGGPFFSPDGKKVVWRRFSEDGHTADVYTINIDGTDEKRITDFNCLSWAPFYYPSGDYIAFSSNKYGFDNFEVFIVDSDGLKEPVRVTYTDKFDGLPVFSPDGKQMVWTTSRTADGKAQLFIADWDDSYAREMLAKSPYRPKKQSFQRNVQFSPEIKVSELNEKLTYIASDELEGRMTGSKGIQLAAEYITAIFTNLGLKPLDPEKDFLWPFDFVSEIKINESDNLLEVNGKKLKVNSDYRPMSSTSNGDISGNVVFAGYGLKVSDGGSFEYDSYASLDVKDKIVMVLEGIPEEIDSSKVFLFERYGSAGYKQMLARENGAGALLMVTGHVSREGYREIVGTSGIISLEISEKTADQILAGHPETISFLRDKLKNGDPHGNDYLIETGTGVTIQSRIERIVKQDNNIVGVVYSGNQDADYIFIGAHYDHLGMGEINSRSTGKYRNEVHNGADDNGSGTVAVIELAEYFSGLKDDNPLEITHHLVFCLWSGEELGLLGSTRFVSDLPVPAEKIKGYLNFDMIGRMNNNRLYVQGVGSAGEWKTILERKNVVAGFDMRLTEDPYLPTDATSFYLKGIPVASFFTGVHNDYHTHRDRVEFINFEDLHRIVKFASLVIRDMLKPEQLLTYNEVQVKARRGNRGGGSVSLGTIPAYAGSDEPGVEIQGVRPGGPADKAGLEANDIIVGLNGKDTNNIYDFMNILNGLKSGVEVEIIINRNGEQRKLMIIPEARD
jgi:Tol biopolymer transport system component